MTQLALPGCDRRWSVHTLPACGHKCVCVCVGFKNGKVEQSKMKQDDFWREAKVKVLHTFLTTEDNTNDNFCQKLSALN